MRSEHSVERARLRKQILCMLDALNECQWTRCAALIDPKIHESRTFSESAYCLSLQRFMNQYGKIELWHVRLSLHLPPHSNTRDSRPFAYASIVWKDAKHRFHMFRERWIKENDRWYSRVVGLISHQDATSGG